MIEKFKSMNNNELKYFKYTRLKEIQCTYNKNNENCIILVFVLSVTNVM